MEIGSIWQHQKVSTILYRVDEVIEGVGPDFQRSNLDCRELYIVTQVGNRDKPIRMVMTRSDLYALAWVVNDVTIDVQLNFMKRRCQIRESTESKTFAGLMVTCYRDIVNGDYLFDVNAPMMSKGEAVQCVSAHVNHYFSERLTENF